MGGIGAHRGSSGGISGSTVQAAPQQPLQPQQPQNNNIQQQTPTAQNTPVTPQALNNISKMDDATLASLINSARGIQMPNMLADSKDATQEFVFAAGLNERPTVLDQKEFDQFMKDNNISKNEILSRSTNNVSYRNQDGTTINLTGDQVNDLIKYSRLTYIGGKRGGQAYGAGTYFDMNGGKNTGYGGTTMNAVLNPKTAKPISLSNLNNKIASYAQAHPQVAQAIQNLTGVSSSQAARSWGSTKATSIYALCMGYNVITEYNTSTKSGYHNVIDRSALVIRK